MGHDMNWSVNFEITLDGKDVNFCDLDAMTQEYILNEIQSGYFSGTTAGAYLDGEEPDFENDEFEIRRI